VTASPDGTARIWDVAGGRIVESLRGHTGYVRSAVFSPDGKLVATGSDDGTARIWDVASGRSLYTLPSFHALDNGGFVTAVFSPDGKLAATDGDGTVQIWSVSSGRRLNVIKSSGGAYHPFFSHDSKRVYAYDGFSGATRIWDDASGRPLHSLPQVEQSSTFFSPDGERLITFAWSEPGMTAQIRFRDPATGRSLRTLSVRAPGDRNAYFLRAVFSPGGKLVVAMSTDRTARIWDVASGRLLHTFHIHARPMGSFPDAFFSHDGKRLATTTGAFAQIWDLASGDRVCTLRGHAGGMIGTANGAAFSPDGTLVLTVSLDDGTARVWDAASCRMLDTLGPE
jgi:WD40 repeat protein